MNWVPRFKGRLGEPHCLFVGVAGFLPGMLRWRGVLCRSRSRLRFRALCEFSSSSSSSLLLLPVAASALDGDRLPVDILEDISPGKEEATRLAATKLEFTDTAAAAAIAAAE